MNTEEKIKALFTEQGIKFHPKTGIEKLLVKLEEVSKDIPEANELLKEVKPKEVKPKEYPVTSEVLLNDFASLFDKLEKYEKSQRKAKKPFRHVFSTKVRIRQLMGAFKRMTK